MSNIYCRRGCRRSRRRGDIRAHSRCIRWYAARRLVRGNFDRRCYFRRSSRRSKLCHNWFGRNCNRPAIHLVIKRRRPECWDRCTNRRAFAGAGYGIGRFAPKLFGFLGERVGPGDNPASFWNQGTFDSPTESMSYHVDGHGLGQSDVEFTNDALTARDVLWNAPGIRQGPVPIGGITRFGTAIRYMTGSIGWKIWPAGIYDYTGGVVTFWG